jgi:hypothetical protein
MIIKDKSKYYRQEGKSGRFYVRRIDESIKYPSVTTVISQSKEKKKFSGSPSATIGTITHYHILKRYSKNLLSLPTESIWNVPRPEIIGRIYRNIKMWNDLNLRIDPIAVETALFCNNPLVAGTLDLLANINGEYTLCDIKTGLYYNSHPIQASVYWHMLRRKPKVCFIYLDGILDRNPEQKAVVRYFTKEELEIGYEDFLDKYSEFVWE